MKEKCLKITRIKLFCNLKYLPFTGKFTGNVKIFTGFLNFGLTGKMATLVDKSVF